MLGEDEREGRNVLVALGKLQVDAHAAVPPGISGWHFRTGRHNVFVERDIKNGAGCVDGNLGVASRTAGADGGDVEDFDVGSR